MIKSLLLSVWILLAFRVMVAAGFPLSSIRDSSRHLEDDDSWGVGTKVYWEFDDGWYEGTITDFDEDGYTIDWCDDSQDYDDFSDEDVDQMVGNYNTKITENGETAQCGPDDTAPDMASDPTAAPTEDDGWDVGTQVYWQFDDGWYYGTIIDFDDMGYTIAWCDDSTDKDDFSDDDVDQMVDNYNTMITENGETAQCGPEDTAPDMASDPTAAPTEDDGWDIGTKLYWEFDDGWYYGTITDFDDMGYTIAWCDDSTDKDDFADEDVDQMVDNYNTMITENGETAQCGPEDTAPDMASDPTAAPTEDDGWDIGTKLYWEFDDGWYEGIIADYNDIGYTIDWCDDSVDKDDYSDEDVDQMVENYNTMVTNAGEEAQCGPEDTDDDSWPIGTKVYWDFSDGWYYGTITDMDDDGYTITWCDDSVDWDEYSDDDVDQMVEDYNTMVAGTGATGSCGPDTVSVANGEATASSDMKPGAKFVVAAVVLLAVFGGVFYVRRLRMNRKEEGEMQDLHHDGTTEIS